MAAEDEYAPLNIHDGGIAVQLAYQVDAPDLGMMQSTSMSLFSNEHFAGEGNGDFAGPARFDIVVRPGDFTIVRPL